MRVESGLFRSSYEASEIWVGKQADVGAQLSVPSVRGDKVGEVCFNLNMMNCLEVVVLEVVVVVCW